MLFSLINQSISQLSPVTLSLLIIALAYIIWLLIKNLISLMEFNRKFNKLPHFPKRGFPFLWVILGHLEFAFYNFFYLQREKIPYQFIPIFGLVDDLRKKKLMVFNFGFHQSIFFYHHKTIEHLMTSSSNIKKSSLYDFVEKLFGDSLGTSFGDKWKRKRKMLTPVFHFKVLESFVPIMSENAQVMIQKIEKLIEKNVNAMEKNGIDIRDLINYFTLDTICETTMGVKVGAQTNAENNEYVKTMVIVLELLMNRIFDPLKHSNLIYYFTKDGRLNNKSLKFIHSYVQKVIDDRFENLKNQIEENQISLEDLNYENIESKTGKRFVFLDSLLLTHLKDPASLKIKNVLDEANSIIFGGHETISSSLTHTLFMIANDKRVQKNVHEEMDSIFGSDHQRKITSDDCRRMKYLEMCIKEGLRLYPSVPMIARRVTQEFSVNKYTIPAGCEAIVPIFVLHQDPEVFPKPRLYIPERFEQDQPIHKMPYAYIPFAAGPRNCIAQKFAMAEMKVILASVFRRFDLNSISLIDENNLVVSAILKSYSPINVSFKLRNHSL